MYKVVVDAGHGGSDSGAVYSGTPEKKLNLEVALVMAEKLRQQGFLVELTRTTDETIEINDRVKKAIAFYNSEPVVPRENRFFISVHHNATSSGSCLNAAWVLHRNDNSISMAFANAINTGLERQGIADNYKVCSEKECSNYNTLGVLIGNTSSSEGTDNVALVEYNFMCADTYSKITNSSWQQSAASGTVDGLVEYANASILPASEWHENIYATIHDFPDGSNASGKNCGAYCVALPERSVLEKNVEVCNISGSICKTVPVIDLGPFCITDSEYVLGSSRPYAEIYKGTVFSLNEGPSCNPRGISDYPESTGAGIDLSPALASELGVPGNGLVKWRFV